jgi:hypothetical protein
VNGREVRHAQIFNAVSEIVLKTYGFVPLDVRESAAASVIQQVVLDQAYYEKYLREEALKVGYSENLVADMLTELHAPLGGAA